MVVQVPRYVLIATLAGWCCVWWILGRLIEDGRRWGMKTRKLRFVRGTMFVLMAVAVAVMVESVVRG